MTCVIAIKSNGIVYMGADSAGSNLYTTRMRIDPKIYMVGAFMFGFTTSFRMGQLLGHSFVAPDRDPRVSTEKYMTTKFIDAVRTCLKDGGYASKVNENESGGVFLVAYEGRVFRIDSDYQVGEGALSYEAVGCGEDIAMGSLYTTAGGSLSPVERIDVALKAAAAFSCGVEGPFMQMQTAAYEVKTA